MARLRTFAYVGADKASLYRAIMRAFIIAKESFALHLRPEDVQVALENAAIDEVDPALRQLVAWGNLRSSPDTADVATLEDFYRERRLYQLTREGEAAERAISQYEETILQPGELQTAALDDIRNHLMELVHLGAAPELDQGKAARALEALKTRFETLTSRAQIFLGGLERAVELHGKAEEELLVYKEKLIGYLDRFMRELVVQRAHIARLLETIDGIPKLLLAAARHETRDRLDREVEEPLVLEEWQRRWAGLRHWFLGSPGRSAQVELLQARARSAIPALLNVIHALHERRVRRTDRRADFRVLARWFAETDADADAHRLYRAAFGLSPSRHLRINAESLDALEQTPVASTARWMDTPTLRLTPRLRATGRHTRRGPERKVVDRSKARAALRVLAEREAQQLEAARRKLELGRVRLSELPELDPDAFGLFLDLLAQALSRQSEPGETVEVDSVDGAFRVRLAPIGDGTQATILTSTGSLSGPDAYFELHALDSIRKEQEDGEAAE